MVTRHIVVMPYDERWAQDFEAIASEIRDSLGELVLAIEHVGSTSVPGLCAKPIIDIDIVIRDYASFGAVVSALKAIGYHHEGDLGIAGREAFGYDGKEHLRRHHLYVCPQDSPELKRHIAFRDYLRAHPDAAQVYGRIKEEGAALHPYDIDGYIEHKSPFIESIYRKLELRSATGGHMKKVKITVKRMARYDDLMQRYENPIEHACGMWEGRTFTCNGWAKPEGMCDSAWETLSPFVMTLAHGGENFYDGWMKDPKSAMISCNDGFRPVSFYVEALDEEVEA